MKEQDFLYTFINLSNILQLRNYAGIISFSSQVDRSVAVEVQAAAVYFGELEVTIGNVSKGK